MIKAIIFDQDGTLYPKESKLYKYTSSLTQNWVKSSLKLNQIQLEKIYTMLKQEFPNPFDGFQYLGLTINDYHDNVFNQVNCDLFIEVDNRLINILEKIKIPKYIVTLSSKAFSEKLLATLQLDTLFEKTYLVSDYKNSNNKLLIYEEIRKNLNLKHSEVCIIGDNYMVDLEDAKMKGYMCILISKEIISDVVTIPSIYSLDDVITNLL